MLPETYATPLHLPFNGVAMEGFTLSPPPVSVSNCDDGPLIILRGTELMVMRNESGLSLPQGKLPPSIATGGIDPISIGTWRGVPCRALPLSRSAILPEGWEGHNLLAPIPKIPIDLLSLGGVAGQILHWERSSRHCSFCGGTTAWIPGEWGRKCLACDKERFPTISPCAIVLVKRPGEVLLIRKAEWPEGRYSLVAGFLDFGECLEEAAVREVREETGVTVENLRYVGSQSWPFPSQLMAGFVADYTGGDIRVETKELEDARWFSIDALPTLPPRRSIARFLIDNYAKEG